MTAAGGAIRLDVVLRASYARRSPRTRISYERHVLFLLARFVHVVCGVAWAGAVIFIAWILLPAIRATGPAGGALMQQLVRVQRLPVYLMVMAILTILSGLSLFWLDIAAFGQGVDAHGSGPHLLGRRARSRFSLRFSEWSSTRRRRRKWVCSCGSIQAAGKPPSAGAGRGDRATAESPLSGDTSHGRAHPARRHLHGRGSLHPLMIRPSRAAFAFIFITVALDMLALGIIVPVLPKLIVAFEGGDVAHAARIVGRLRLRLGGDAVPRIAGRRRDVGSIRAATGRPALELRARTRLSRDGDRAERAVAVRGANRLGDHVVELSHGERVHRRRDAARSARGEVRNARRRVRARIHHRARRGRRARRHRPATAVLGCGRAQSRERGVRILHSAGVASAGEARARAVAHGESARIALLSARASRAARARRDVLSLLLRARGLSDAVRALRRLSLRVVGARARDSRSRSSASDRRSRRRF